MTQSLIGVSCVPHHLHSKDLTKFSLYVWPKPVSNRMTELLLEFLAFFFKSRNSMSVSWDQTLNKIWVVFGAVSHIGIQWSMTLVYVSSYEEEKAILLQLPLYPCLSSEISDLSLQNICIYHVPLSMHLVFCHLSNRHLIDCIFLYFICHGTYPVL